MNVRKRIWIPTIRAAAGKSEQVIFNLVRIRMEEDIMGFSSQTSNPQNGSQEGCPKSFLKPTT